MDSRKKYHNFWTAIWRISLEHKICPFARCDLSKSTCRHLSRFINYNPSDRKIQPDVFFIDDIEEEADTRGPKEAGEVWEFFKKLRKYKRRGARDKGGLSNDQIGILVRKFGMNMNDEQIRSDMNWTSKSMFDIRYNSAIDLFRKLGFEE